MEDLFKSLVGYIALGVEAGAILLILIGTAISLISFGITINRFSIYLIQSK